MSSQFSSRITEGGKLANVRSGFRMSSQERRNRISDLPRYGPAIRDITRGPLQQAVGDAVRMLRGKARAGDANQNF